MRNKGLFLLLGVLITVFFLAGTSANVYSATILLEDNFDTENGGVIDFAYNYDSFANWNVINGAIDLIPFPGYGLSIDLDGTHPEYIAGTMETKTAFNLEPDIYELQFDLSGSDMGSYSEIDTVLVTLGVVYSEEFTFLYYQPFTTITRNISVISPTNGKLRFEHYGGDWVGLRLDNVSLTQLDTTPVPEPYTTTMLLLAGGYVGLLGWRRRSKK